MALNSHSYNRFSSRFIETNIHEKRKYVRIWTHHLVRENLVRGTVRVHRMAFVVHLATERHLQIDWTQMPARMASVELVHDRSTLIVPPTFAAYVCPIRSVLMCSHSSDPRYQQSNPPDSNRNQLPILSNCAVCDAHFWCMYCCCRDATPAMSSIATNSLAGDRQLWWLRPPTHYLDLNYYCCWCCCCWGVGLDSVWLWWQPAAVCPPTGWPHWNCSHGWLSVAAVADDVEPSDSSLPFVLQQSLSYLMILSWIHSANSVTLISVCFVLCFVSGVWSNCCYFQIICFDQMEVTTLFGMSQKHRRNKCSNTKSFAVLVFFFFKSTQFSSETVFYIFFLFLNPCKTIFHWMTPSLFNDDDE